MFDDLVFYSFTFSLGNTNSYFEVKPNQTLDAQALGSLRVKNENLSVTNDEGVNVYPVTITAEDRFQLSYTKTILLVNRGNYRSKLKLTSSCYKTF